MLLLNRLLFANLVVFLFCIRSSHKNSKYAVKTFQQCQMNLSGQEFFFYQEKVRGFWKLMSVATMSVGSRVQWTISPWTIRINRYQFDRVLVKARLGGGEAELFRSLGIEIWRPLVQIVLLPLFVHRRSHFKSSTVHCKRPGNCLLLFFLENKKLSILANWSCLRTDSVELLWKLQTYF